MASPELQSLIRKTKSTSIRDVVNKRVLQTLHTMTEQRIFRDGIDANEQLIGVYSEGYQKTRNKRNYPTSIKVILQATRQMVNDYKLIVLPGNNYGSGFSNNFNYQKSFWVEDTYDTLIFDLTDSEERKLSVMLDREISKILR